MFRPCHAVGHAAPRRYPRQPLTLVCGGQHCSIHERTVQQYLPVLWRKHTRRMMLDAGYLDLEDYKLLHGPNYSMAVTLLFRYLGDVDRKSKASAALSTGLEDVWRESDLYDNGESFHPSEIFECLATMFKKQSFGCNAKIFKEMESFFQRHCAEILQRGLNYWTCYIGGLARMSANDPGLMDMASVLAPVVHEMNSKGLDARMLSGYLDPRSQRILTTLDRQEQQRPPSPPRFGTHLVPVSAHRPLLHRGLSLPPVSLRGDEFDPATRLHLAQHYPHRLSIHDHELNIPDPWFAEDLSDNESIRSTDANVGRGRRHSLHNYSLDGRLHGRLLGLEPRFQYGL